LIDDPLDLERFGSACDELLGDRERATALGMAAREWVIERFLGPRHLLRYLALLEDLLGATRPAATKG